MKKENIFRVVVFSRHSLGKRYGPVDLCSCRHVQLMLGYITGRHKVQDEKEVAIPYPPVQFWSYGKGPVPSCKVVIDAPRSCSLRLKCSLSRPVQFRVKYPVSSSIGLPLILFPYNATGSTGFVSFKHTSPRTNVTDEPDHGDIHCRDKCDNAMGQHYSRFHISYIQYVVIAEDEILKERTEFTLEYCAHCYNQSNTLTDHTEHAFVLHG